jgi:hypothetical protein
MFMPMKVKNHLWKKKDSNQQEDRQLHKNNLKLKGTTQQKLKLELQDMKLTMSQDMITNQTDTNLSL